MNSLVILTTLARAVTFIHPTYSDVDMKLNMSGCVYRYFVLYSHEFRPKRRTHADQERTWTLTFYILKDLYLSPNIIRVIKSIRIRSYGQITGLSDRRVAHRAT
jgi:hypothetical protein